MIPNLLSSITDWNAQLFRELKGRLKPRNFILTAVASALVQGVVLLFFSLQLPSGESLPKYPLHNLYCTGKPVDTYSDLRICVQAAPGIWQVNWSLWWFNIFQVLSWLLPFVLLMAGVYMLITDLAKEEKRGTLNFIRLSPQTSQSILLGKALGVPALPILAVAMAVPLHGLAAAAGQVPWAEIISIYLITAGACAFFYSGAIFYAFLGGAQSWLGAIATWGSYSIFFSLFQASRSDYADRGYLFLDSWFGVEVGRYLYLLVPFGLVTLGIGSFWFWQAINRRFRNPSLTLISKRQSYLVTASVQVLMLGFAYRNYSGYSRPTDALVAMMMINLVWFPILIAALTPHRQTLLDWSRYRHRRSLDSDAEPGMTAAKRSPWRDRLLGEKSPALTALGVNLLIPMAITTPWILGWTALDNTYWDWGVVDMKLAAYSGLGMQAIFLLVCGLLAQMVLFMKAKKRTIFAATVVLGVIFMPPIFLGMLSSIYYNTTDHSLWAFTSMAFAPLLTQTIPGDAYLIYFASFLGQAALLTVLTLRFNRQLQKAGESELKALLPSRST